MLSDLSRNKKATGLILIGLAAFAVYKYSKMTSEEKSNILGKVSQAGKNLLGQIMGDANTNEVAG